jgi:FtsH-binding integral membrane protein
MGAFLFTGLMSLILIAGLGFLFGFASMMQQFIQWASILLFSGFVIYDTSAMLHHYTPDDAFDACINLYLDFLNLFTAILDLMSSQAD